MERGVNKHHIFHDRAWYKTPEEKRLRNYEGLVIPMDVDIHRQLHLAVKQPPKPPRKLLIPALEFMDDLPFTTLQNAPETVYLLAEHFHGIRDRVAGQIGVNLVKQLAFVEEGYRGGPV